jgi:hypothetical protein
MDVKELSERLKEIGVPKKWYLINEGIDADVHVLEEFSGLWKYHYRDDRGVVRNEKNFLNEADACQYFYDKLNEIIKAFPKFREH